ncbi:MAG: hypothetical protein AB9856_00255 [Cellulosilyticaceae bacterium]
MKKYKLIALLGVVIMGLSSFAACLAQNVMLINLGNIGLVMSIIIMSYGFAYWQP